MHHGQWHGFSVHCMGTQWGTPAGAPVGTRDAGAGDPGTGDAHAVRRVLWATFGVPPAVAVPGR